MDLATHDIDLTQWVTGSRYRTVSAFTARPSGRRHEDMAAVSGMLRNGIITSHLVNWLSSMKERVVTVTGERGCLTADTLATSSGSIAMGQSRPTVPLIAHSGAPRKAT